MVQNRLPKLQSYAYIFGFGKIVVLATYLLSLVTVNLTGPIG